MKELKAYFEAKRQVFEYFGYEEQWRDYPLDDNTDSPWAMDDRADTVHFADSLDELKGQHGNYYAEEIVGKVYTGAEYTMIAVDTHTDGNQFLAIFDNSKRVSWEEFEAGIEDEDEDEDEDEQSVD